MRRERENREARDKKRREWGEADMQRKGIPHEAQASSEGHKRAQLTPRVDVKVNEPIEQQSGRRDAPSASSNDPIRKSGQMDKADEAGRNTQFAHPSYLAVAENARKNVVNTPPPILQPPPCITRRLQSPPCTRVVIDSSSKGGNANRYPSTFFPRHQAASGQWTFVASRSRKR